MPKTPCCKTPPKLVDRIKSNTYFFHVSSIGILCRLKSVWASQRPDKGVYHFSPHILAMPTRSNALLDHIAHYTGTNNNQTKLEADERAVVAVEAVMAMVMAMGTGIEMAMVTVTAATTMARMEDGVDSDNGDDGDDGD